MVERSARIVATHFSKILWNHDRMRQFDLQQDGIITKKSGAAVKMDTLIAL